MPFFLGGGVNILNFIFGVIRKMNIFFFGGGGGRVEAGGLEAEFVAEAKFFGLSSLFWDVTTSNIF